MIIQMNSWSGSAAFNHIVANSALGKNSLSYGTTNYAAQLQINNFTDPNNPEEIDHKDTSSTVFDPTKGGQSETRVVTIKENLSPAEQEVFTQKIKDLKKTNIISDALTYKAKGFYNISDAEKIQATDSRDIGPKTDFLIDAKEDFSSYNDKTVVPCASLIECLLYLNTKLKIKGSFDFGRGWMSTQRGTLTSGATLTDHVCGRGIDIFHIGSSESDMINLKNGNESDHKRAMELLLPVLDAMDASLHPDLLAVSGSLAKEYGMVRGSYEIDPNQEHKKLNGILQKKYKSLRRIDFHPDEGHRDHIHLAFGPERAGNYLDWTETSSSTGSTDSSVEVNKNLVKGDPNVMSELFKSFYTEPTKKIENTNALYRALVLYGKFSPEVAAIFMCIAERESHYGPGSLTIDEDDYSIGLFQTNYSDTTNARFVDRNVTLLTLDASSRSGIPKKETSVLWKLILTNWKELGITNGTQATAKIKEYRIAKKGREFADPRLFTPINQIRLLVSYVEEYKYRWKFTSWGEYPNGPAFGWITKLKFDTAVQFYVENNPGKTKADLLKFCSEPAPGGFRDSMIIPASKINYTKWLNGETFE